MENLAKFIVIEGADGAGTTTQSKALSNLLVERNTTMPLVTKEPYQGHINNLIRNILSGDSEYQQYRNSLTWLYLADREYHIRDFIIPTLEANIDVISDRYIPSTMAYQSENKQFSEYDLYNLNYMSRFLKPDLTVYIKVPVEISIQRLAGRSHQEIFEKQEFLEKLYHRYDETFKILTVEGWNILEVDGTQKSEVITEQIYEEYLSLIEIK